MVISKTIEITELVEQNYRILPLLERLEIYSFLGEDSLEEACRRVDADAGTLLLIAEVCEDPRFRPSDKSLKEANLDTVLKYLHNSHSYYRDKALHLLSESLERLLSGCAEKQKQAIWSFFTDYEDELAKHFTHEEGHVRHYIEHLRSGSYDEARDIDHIDDCHDNIIEKISDLKSLVLKSLPSQCLGPERLQALSLVSALKEDLEAHGRIEELVLEPMIRLMESELYGREIESSDASRESLSEREKEILVGVATGLINKEIADRFNISIHTVITHRKNITRKTGIKSVAGLTVYALLNGLIDMNSVE